MYSFNDIYIYIYVRSEMLSLNVPEINYQTSNKQGVSYSAWLSWLWLLIHLIKEYHWFSRFSFFKNKCYFFEQKNAFSFSLSADIFIAFLIDKRTKFDTENDVSKKKDKLLSIVTFTNRCWSPIDSRSVSFQE